VDLLIYTCETSQTLWYFTKPGHPAHPGVIKRYVFEDAQGVKIGQQGWSFASDAAQPAFKTFLAQIRALDEQMKEAVAAQHGGPPMMDSAMRVYGNWQPQPGDNEAVVSLTRYYFSLVDGGRYEDSYALFDGSLTAMLPFAQYVGLADHTIAAVGHVKARTLKTIDWEKDSPQGPPGLYAALDYSADTDKGLLCGYVAWRREPDGFFVLVREETNTLPATLDAAQLAALKIKFRCVD